MKPVDYRRRVDDAIEGKMDKSNVVTCAINGERRHELHKKRSKFRVGIEVRNILDQRDRGSRRRRQNVKLYDRIAL